MSNIRFRASKKTLVILFLMLFLILGGSGGYLLWRVNQSKTVAPTDSHANGCPYFCVWPYVSWYFTGELPGTERGCQCAPCNYDRPGAGPYCLDSAPTCNPVPCPNGYEEFRYNWNCNAMWDGGERKRVETFLRNNNVPNPQPCSDTNNEKICVTTCQARCAGCDNPYTAHRYCVKKAFCGDGNKDPGEVCDPGPEGSDPVACTDINGKPSVCNRRCECPPNTCDRVGSSGVITLSTTTPEHCKSVSFEYTAGDTDGVGNVTVKLDGTDIAFTENLAGNTKKITGTIPGDKNCNTNKRTLTISWVDVHGTGGSLCTESVEYTPKAAPPPQDTTCDPSKAGWNDDPKDGEFETCKAPVKYSYNVADPQGVDLSSIVVTLNGQRIAPSKESKTGTSTVVTVSGTLNTSDACLPPGSKTLKIVWKDKNGNPKGTEKPCTAETKFTIKEKNTCDAIGAGWRDKQAPPKEIVEGKGIVAHYIAADKDGVGSIDVLFDNAPLTSINKVPFADGTKVTITITIPITKLTLGNHSLQISWKDKLGIGGETPCKVVHNILVKERLVPNWDIEKVAKEECIDDGTENPISKITNTITIKNEGNGSGTIAGVVDTLDTKVVGSTLSGITEGGVYGNGKITWSRFQLPAGGTKVLTYSYTVAKDKFDIYQNNVKATVEGGATLDAGATIEARCNVVNPSCGDGNLDASLGEQCDPPGSTCTNAYGESSVCTDTCTCPGEPPSIPETGIFDDSRKVVAMGAVLLFTGIGWTWLSSTYKLVNGKLVQRRKENFEQRVVKR